MKLFIKNMVCDRCVLVLQQTLEDMNIPALSVALGEVELKEELQDDTKNALQEKLNQLGFELINDKKSRTIEKIKSLIIDLVHNKYGALDSNLSTYLSDKMHQDYSALSNLFSEVENSTIEKYYIAQKIEKVKELLVYDEKSISEIADLMHYSSPAYLSSQFKKITGFSPAHFKKIKENRRKAIDRL